MLYNYYYRGLFWALFVVSIILSESVSKLYIAQLNKDDVFIRDNLLAEYDAYSITMCAAVCGPECRYFGVNLHTKKCRVYSGCQPDNSTEIQVGWKYYSSESEGCKHPLNCKALLADGHTMSAVYTIYPCNNQWSVNVQCDMTTKGGGWTVIQRRVDGSTDFDRTWQEYKEGFGSVNSSYWLGNDVIYLLTNQKPSLYLSITLTNGTTLYQQYGEFSISNEADNYRLYLNGPTTGTLGDSMMLNTGMSDTNLFGMAFSTPDRDNDGWSAGNWAALTNIRGGWWFNKCHYAFLNGPWSPEDWHYPWFPLLRDGTEIKETVMMIKTH
ncbi:ryncolin-4-like [Saccostrea cucullata]|uniref:ryncolin-4-like n=1 Tax=Saccostrea cuccullata TaxID=36930 RepID=UPI002ED47725